MQIVQPQRSHENEHVLSLVQIYEEDKGETTENKDLKSGKEAVAKCVIGSQRHFGATPLEGWEFRIEISHKQTFPPPFTLCVSFIR